MRSYSSPLYKRYIEDIVPALLDKYGEKNSFAIPQITKVVLNMGVAKAKDDKNLLEEAIADLSLIAGQKAVTTKARKSISNFGVREGMSIGTMVTLRGSRMYDFLDKLLQVVIPRIRDFNGIKESFDSFGNLSIGIEDESIFPEINADKMKYTKGLSITVVTDLKSREKSQTLMDMMGFPFKKEEG
jgi:large subunit ribosomal protein L5